jgi:hypothetical protein
VVLVAVSTGCYYRRYDALVRTHVDLIVQMAEKRRDLAAREFRVPSAAEFSYPLERGRDFARIVRSRFAGRQSFERFERFLALYADFLAAASAPDVPASELDRPLEAVRSAGSAVIAALDEERG